MSGANVRRCEAAVARGDVAAWIKAFRARACPGMRAVDGFQAVTFLAERDADPCRVTGQSTSDDRDVVRRHAGDDPARTVMPGFRAPFFTAYDAEARFHDEVLVEAGQ